MVFSSSAFYTFALFILNIIINVNYVSRVLPLVHHHLESALEILSNWQLSLNT